MRRVTIDTRFTLAPLASSLATCSHLHIEYLEIGIGKLIIKILLGVDLMITSFSYVYVSPAKLINRNRLAMEPPCC